MDLHRPTVRLRLSTGAGAGAGLGSGAGAGPGPLSDACERRVRAQGQGSRSRAGSGAEAHPRSDTTSLAEYGRVVSDQRGSHCQRVSRNLVSSLTERFSMVCRAQGGWASVAQSCTETFQRLVRGSERAWRGIWPAVLSSRAADEVVRVWRPRRTRIIERGLCACVRRSGVDGREPKPGDELPFWAWREREKSGRFRRNAACPVPHTHHEASTPGPPATYRRSCARLLRPCVVQQQAGRRRGTHEAPTAVSIRCTFCAGEGRGVAHTSRTYSFPTRLTHLAGAR